MINEEQEIPKQNIENFHTFSDKLDDILYDIKIGIVSDFSSKDLIFLHFIPKNLSKNPVEFLLKFSLETLLSKSNKMFGNCSTVKDALDNISFILDKRTYELKRGDNCLILRLKCALFGKKLRLNCS